MDGDETGMDGKGGEVRLRGTGEGGEGPTGFAPVHEVGVGQSMD